MAKIMIVDDSSLSRRMLKKILAVDAYDVVEAEDGLIAIEKYALEKPAVVLLDMTMRGMDGLEVLRQLRRLHPQAKVIMATADVQDSTRQMAQDEGASGFVPKPFMEDTVLKAVRAVLEETYYDSK